MNQYKLSLCTLKTLFPRIQMIWYLQQMTTVVFKGLPGSAVGHRSVAPGFKPLSRAISAGLFHLSLRPITFAGRSAHLADLVHKSGRKTARFNVNGLNTANIRNDNEQMIRNTKSNKKLLRNFVAMSEQLFKMSLTQLK